MKLNPLALVLTAAIASAAAGVWFIVNQSHLRETPPIAAHPAKSSKWQIPDAMMLHLKNLETDLERAQATAPTDHPKLAGQIEQHISQLIASCTMDGKGHDALHLWLADFRDLAATHANSKQNSSADQALEAMRLSFTPFHAQFEGTNPSAQE